MKEITTVSLDGAYKKEAKEILRDKYGQTLSGYINQMLIKFVNNHKGGKEENGTNNN
jgi:hypothetical protein